ncbi:MAG: indolepyruvate oxidoreductase subunit beta [Phycisphaerales bacterium]|nr:indolepyruvate oxidoreductase subunit beta [Phycisphaerales bacterium]
MKDNKVTNVVIAGLGGQGVLKASDILSRAIFDQGLDLKKSEIHGMSQRGGSVTSDVRFGKKVHSPMVPVGEADFVVVLAPEEVENARRYLRPTGVLITPDAVDGEALSNKRSINVALLGILSRHLEIPESVWRSAIRACLPEKLLEVNENAFTLGRGTS